MPGVPGWQTPSGSACDPAIPHKDWFHRVAKAMQPGSPVDLPSYLSQMAQWEQENWLELERWARVFRTSCLPSGSGSCLTATSTTQVFDPTSAGGNGGRTSPWQPYTAMNLVTLRARCAYEPAGGDIEVLLWDEASATQLGSTVTLVDGVDTEASWTGTVAVDTSMRIYFEVNGSVAIELFEIEAWFDGVGGGGLIIYPEGGV